MIGKSFPELIFIRCSIFLLRAIPLLASLYSATRLVFSNHHVPPVIEYWLIAECLFYVLIYLPRRESLQKPAVHPELESRARRQALLDRCLSYLPDPDRFITTWFLSSSFLDVKRENFIDWLLWALFSTDRRRSNDYSAMEDELNESLDKIERIIGRKIEPGISPSIKPMRLTLDPVVMLHRPLVWYAIVAIVDCITYASLHNHGFKHYSPSLRTKIFPPRPQTFFSRWSVASNLPYWYRPHQSSSKLPIVFLHGIGIGLWPYVSFFADLKKIDPDVGILALEILPISMRVTNPVLQRTQFIEQLTHILVLHDILEFVLVSHSYGSVLTTHILRSSLSPRVSSVLLVDPVSLLLYIPDVAYNFVYRKPKTANQWQLWYFASRDMGISHTLSRHFFWSDNILWKEDLVGRRVGIALSGEDQIVNAREVWKYVTSQQDGRPDKLWKDDKGQLNVFWYPGLDHAQVFDTFERRRPLLKLLEEFMVPG